MIRRYSLQPLLHIVSTFGRRPTPHLRAFHNNTAKMTDLEVELTAPNGVKYQQPLGLFINNEWVKSKKGDKITSINPT